MGRIDDDVKLAAFLMLMPFIVMLMILAIVIWGPKLHSVSVIQIIAVIFLAISAVMLSGRGAWAVAGYNTMSEIEKARYDPKEIARGCGLIMLGMAVFLAFFLYGGAYLFGSIAALAIMTFLGIVYMNRFGAVEK